MTKILNTDNNEFESNMDSLMKSYLDSQITCMMLQHNACIEVRDGNLENGLIMLESVYKMRESLSKQKQEIIDTFGIEEIEAACGRINFDNILYARLSDEMLGHNALYFNIEPRPLGEEYYCDEDVAKRASQMLYREYFPTLIAA
ncbi:MAG: hypothetical protein WCL30_00700 [Pseudomonadota bacterium]